MWEWISRAWSRGKGSRFGGRLGVNENVDWDWWCEEVVVVGGIGGRVVYRRWDWGSWIRRKGFSVDGVGGRIVVVGGIVIEEGIKSLRILVKVDGSMGGLVEGEVRNTKSKSED